MYYILVNNHSAPGPGRMEENMEQMIKDMNMVIDDVLEDLKGLAPEYRAVEQAAGFRDLVRILEQYGHREEEI